DLIRLIPDDFGIEKVEVRNSVAIEVLVEAPHYLHVLLRHRLLPQSGGFEGAVPIEEALRLADQPIPERNQVAPQPVHFGCVRGDSVAAGDPQRPVVEVDDLLDVYRELVVDP